MDARTIVVPADGRSVPATGADIEEYSRRSYELWQQMASRWERGRAVLWETTRPVSEWLIDRLSPEPGQTVLDLAAGMGETGFLAADRLGDAGRLISSDFAPEMVQAAERVARELEITNAEFRVLDAERLELEKASVCRWPDRARLHVRCRLGGMGAVFLGEQEAGAGDCLDAGRTRRQFACAGGSTGYSALKPRCCPVDRGPLASWALVQASCSQRNP